MWWFGAASAATLTVGPGQQYPSVGGAIAAASPGDRIEISAGTYSVTTVVDKRLTLVGVGAVVLQKAAAGPLSPMFRVTADATFQNLVLDGLGAGTNCVSVDSPPLAQPARTVRVIGSTFQNCSSGISGDDATFLDVTDSRFTDNLTGVFSLGDTSVERSRFERNGTGIFSNQRGWLVANAFFDHTHAAMSLDLLSQTVARNAFCNNDGSHGAITGTTFMGDPLQTVTIKNNRFADNQATTGAAVDLQNDGYGDVQAVLVRGNTFVDNSGSTGAHLRVSGIDLTVTNNVFALGGGATDAVAIADNVGIYGQPLPASLGGDYNLFWSNAGGDYGAPLAAPDFGTHTLFGADPMFTAYSADATCNDDLTTRAGSPAIDAGDPSLTDHRDGTRSDIGWVPYN